MRLWPFGRKNEIVSNKSLGQFGEKLAAKTLKRTGYKILARNYRCPKGEIDIIAFDRSTRKLYGAETIVFVEVKTRKSDSFATPQSAVNYAKKQKIQKAARYYMLKHNTGGFIMRYDIIAIVAPDNREPKIEHIKDIIDNGW